MPMLEIRKIKCFELNAFYEEVKNNPILPISTKRILSYQNNPKRNETLPVLYLGYIGNNLVTYRSVLQDQFQTQSDEKVSCVWLSGSSTAINFRKKGYSRILLDEISKDYKGYIMNSNYGSHSFSLFSKRTDLVNYRFLEGYRFYYRFSLAEILPSKSTFFKKIRPFLKLTDQISNLIFDLRYIFYSKKKIADIEIAKFDQELANFISNHNKNSLFKRNTEDFQWIFDFPWVIQSAKDGGFDKKYYFTTSAKRFQKKAFVLRKNNEIKGFLLYSIKNEQMNVHYIFCDSQRESADFSQFIWTIIRSEKISSLVMTDKRLIDWMQKKGGYIFSKTWNKGYFAGKELLKSFPEIQNNDIYMGDGDTIFT